MEQDFRIASLDELIRGIYYPETDRSIVYVGQHDSLEEIFLTCEHEAIHGAIGKLLEEDELNVDTEHEHFIIKRIQWAEEILV